MAKSTPLKKDRQVESGKQGNLHELEKILELMEKHDVVELDWERGDERLRLKTRNAVSDATAASVAAFSGYRVPHEAQQERVAPLLTPPSSVMTQAPVASSGLVGNQKHVPSPFVGTFYRASSPEGEPYVREGKMIKRGDVLCIIEAMKLMNEIEAEFPGKIVSVLVENGQPVEFGEPLFVIEP